METIKITGNNLTIEDIIKVAYQNAQVELGNLDSVRRSAEVIAHKVSSGDKIYGVTTGFGPNVDKNVKPADAAALQINLLLSHATGVGANFPKHVVRAIMVIRLNTLLKGYSGVKESTVRQLESFLNLGIHPLIPQQGSVGASGDLCPLSHMALPLIGRGYLEYKDQEYEASDFYRQIKKKEIKLESGRRLGEITLDYKEGLALNNGTTVIAALGVLAVYEFDRLLKLATLTSSLMFEAFCARKSAFDEKIQLIRNHGEQIEIARWIRTFTRNSSFFGIDWQTLKSASRQKDDLMEKLSQLKKKPQDSYSFRCLPQVFGASLRALSHARETLVGEINAAVDNPLIFVDEEEVISGGNFHGQPVGIVLDYLKIAIAEVGDIVERQINKLVDSATNDLLNPFLVYDDDAKRGINSGLMIPQYVAASLVSENKVLVHPATADSIPTSANTEDHVSMGTIAARQALEILENVKNVVSIAILTAHHAMQIRREQFDEYKIEAVSAKPTRELFNKVNEVIPDFLKTKGKDHFLKADRFLFDDLKKIRDNYESFIPIAEKPLIEKKDHSPAGTNPARGMRDFLAADARRRDYVISVIKQVYQKYGYEPLETPALENLETLMGKYGEEGNKLIYKVLKRGAHEKSGEADLALRYDLTVPLARVIANYKNDLPKFFKRYQIQPVWRADKPGRGRFREFYQCDIDAIGSKSMLVEADVFSAISEVLKTLGFKDFVIRLNHRQILRGMLEASGIEPDKGDDALVALDKLDKIEEKGVFGEMLDRGISPDAAKKLLDIIGQINKLESNALKLAALGKFVEGTEFGAIGCDELGKLLQYSDGLSIKLDPSLARGLSYYTGAIMEGELLESDFKGSIGGGGRYDELIGMFGKEQIPACGFSFGLERILVVMEERGMFPPEIAASKPADVMVTIWNEDSVGESLRLAGELRVAGLRVLVYPEADKLGKQFKYAGQIGVLYVCVIGESELADGAVTVKNMQTGDQETVPRAGVAETITGQ